MADFWGFMIILVFEPIFGRISGPNARLAGFKVTFGRFIGKPMLFGVELLSQPV